MIKLYRVDGMLIIGEAAVGLVKSPRVIEMIPAANGQMQLRFLMLIGNPKEIIMSGEAFSYNCEDEQLLNVYREAVTGLTIAKTLPEKVVPIRG